MSPGRLASSRADVDSRLAGVVAGAVVCLARSVPVGLLASGAAAAGRVPCGSPPACPGWRARRPASATAAPASAVRRRTPSFSPRRCCSVACMLLSVSRSNERLPTGSYRPWTRLLLPSIKTRSTRMRILLWHGYLLGGTGSNVYTRALAREWARAGHEVTVVCQERNPERFDLGGARVVRPELPAACCRCSSSTATRGSSARLLQDFTPRGARAVRRGERGRAARAGAGRPRLREPRPARRARSAPRAGCRSRSRRTAPSSSTRCAATPSSPTWGRGSLAGAAAVFVGSAHIRARARGRRRARRARARGAAGRRHRRVPPGAARGGARRRCSRRRAATRRTRATARSGCPDEGNAERLERVLRERRADGRSTSASCSATRASTCSSRRCARSTARAAGRRLRRLPRRARATRARGHALHRAARAPPPRARCCRSATSPSCRRSSPRRSAWSPPRPPRPAARRSSRATRASPRSPRGSRRSTRRAAARPGRVRERRRRRPGREAARACSRSRPAERGGRSARPRARRRGRALELGAASPPACCNRPTKVIAVGDEQRLSPDEQLAYARASSSRRAAT